MSEGTDPSAGSTPRRPAPGAGGLRGFIRQNPVLIGQWLKFLVLLGGFMALAQWASDWVNIKMAEWTASVMAVFLNLVGAHARTDGIEIISRMCRFQIIGECTAYYPCAIFIAAVLSYPCPWRPRLLGVLLGIPAILAINQFRLLSLCWIYHEYYEYFETLHLVVWQSLIMFITVLLWIVWVQTLARRHETGPS